MSCLVIECISYHLVLLLYSVELAFGQLFLNHTWPGVCVLVWAFPCGLMLLLHLVELAFGQLFFNHTWLGVCVLVWAFPCGLMLLLHAEPKPRSQNPGLGIESSQMQLCSEECTRKIKEF